ncbi:hypothetical protein F4802DRAFT_608015 [Xylaria palmicola]|nr:hypothetical protein F4802DRAFT_608015 [Xylaria palmicola]
MSKELSELRSQGLRPQTTSTTSADDSGFSADVSGSSASAITPDNFDLSIETVQIGSVIIAADTAIEAFKIFASLFHPNFPLLVSINISAIHHSSPLLFWTIVIIVASRTTVPSSENLFNRIAAPFEDMLRTQILQAPLPLQRIQALVLLCMWPLPVNSQLKDPSWLYSGIAVNSALSLGLHWSGSLPPSRRTSVFQGTPLERVLTWLGCFYVSGSLSIQLGLPVVIDSAFELSRVSACLQDYPIPREFAAQIKLQAIIADFAKILSQVANDGAINTSILNLLDRDIDGLKASYSDQWPCMLEYYTLVAKLHMYGLVISRDSVGSTAREVLLKLSFSTCLRVIHLANVRHNELSGETHGLSAFRQQLALPKAYFRGLAFTTALLLRYFSLNSTASAEEQRLAANHVIISHSILKSCSFSPTDEFGRTARAFEELCKHGPTTMDPVQVGPGDGVDVLMLIRAMFLASERPDNKATSSTEPLVPPTTHSLVPNPSLIPPDALGVSMDQTVDWSVDMMLADQCWNDSAWYDLNLPFMETPFQP